MPLKLDIKNFGPITSGSFELKPLTIFIGPNNTGKSYAAMLTHGIINAPRSSPSLPTSLREKASKIASGLYKTLYETFIELVDEAQESRHEILRTFISYFYEERLGYEISRLFASPIRDLRRIDSRSSSLDLTLNTISISLSHLSKGFELKSFCHPRIDVNINDVYTHTTPSLYLPAARSGILQGHKALAAGFIERAPFVGLEKRLEIPRLSGVVSDFISSILTLEDKPGSLYELTEDFEQKLLRGNIVIPANGDLLYPEIQFQFRETNIPLHRASSTVSELAPLFLYTKYKVEPGSLLIIEEPEAHLHPQNQRILAEFLVKLVRRGVHLLLTTHSEYLLEQFSNFIQLSQVKPSKRRSKFPYEKDVYLEAGEVAAYAFRPDPNPRGTGHKIYPIEIDEDGIPQEDFTDVYNSLYEEGLRLHYELGNGNVG